MTYAAIGKTPTPFTAHLVRPDEPGSVLGVQLGTAYAEITREDSVKLLTYLAAKFGDESTKALLAGYSEWLDVNGLIAAPSQDDKRSHTELVEEFLRGQREHWTVRG